MCSRGEAVFLRRCSLKAIVLVISNKQTITTKREKTNKNNQTRTNKQTQTNKQEQTNKNKQTRTDRQEQANKNKQTRTDRQEQTNKNKQTRTSRREQDGWPSRDYYRLQPSSHSSLCYTRPVELFTPPAMLSSGSSQLDCRSASSASADARKRSVRVGLGRFLIRLDAQKET